MIGYMKRKIAYSDVPIRSAVIAWQPAFLPRYRGDAPAGAVAVFAFLDPGQSAYAITHGAGWCDWAEQPASDLIEALDWLKCVMVDDYGIALRRIEAAFAVIPEYRSR